MVSILLVQAVVPNAHSGPVYAVLLLCAGLLAGSLVAVGEAFLTRKSSAPEVTGAAARGEAQPTPTPPVPVP